MFAKGLLRINRPLQLLLAVAVVPLLATAQACGGEEGTITPKPIPVQTGVNIHLGLYTPQSPGSDLDIPVLMSPGPFGVSAGELTISFDPKAFEASSIAPGDLLGPDPLVGFEEIDNQAGRIRYALARVGPTTVPTEAGIFARIKIKIKGSAPGGQYQITARAQLADEKFQDLIIKEVTNAGITVR